jgi:hypothetical protein
MSQVSTVQYSTVHVQYKVPSQYNVQYKVQYKVQYRDGYLALGPVRSIQLNEQLGRPAYVGAGNRILGDVLLRHINDATVHFNSTAEIHNDRSRPRRGHALLPVVHRVNHDSDLGVRRSPAPNHVQVHQIRGLHRSETVRDATENPELPLQRCDLVLTWGHAWRERCVCGTSVIVGT